MQALDNDLAFLEQTLTQDIPNSKVAIVGDQSSTLYLEDSSFNEPIFLEISNSPGGKEPRSVQQFQLRMQKVTQLQHPNVAPILDIGTTDSNQFYAAIQHFTAIPLTQRLVELKRSPEMRTAAAMLDMVGQLANGLATVHEAGIIHQDLRPEKILLNEHNKPLLIGFTVTQSPNQTRTTIQDMEPVDELDYASPEQVAGEKVTAASNIYSLGILLYELLAGQRPTMPIGQWQVADSPQASQEIPLEEVRKGLAPETYALVRRCLKDAPYERFRSMKELQTAIQAAIIAEETEVKRVIHQHTAAAPQRRFPAWIVAVLLLLVLIGLGAGAAFFLRGPADTQAMMEPEGENGAAMVVAETAVPTETPDAEATAAIVAAQTAAAEEAAAAAAEALAAATLAPTATPEPEPTIIPTAVVIEAEICQPTADIVLVYPHEARGYNLTLTGINFPLNWEIKNSGSCPVPGTTKLSHVAGEAFGFDTETITLADELAVDSTAIISTTLLSPEAAGTYTSTWQLVDEDENPVSELFTFALRTFVSENEVAEAAADIPQPLDWSYTIDGSSCRYAGDDWTCEVSIVPTGGGGDYTLQMFDLPGGQASVQSGAGPFSYQARAKRCEPFKRDLTLADGNAGVSLDASLFFTPNDFFNCEQPAEGG